MNEESPVFPFDVCRFHAGFSTSFPKLRMEMTLESPSRYVCSCDPHFFMNFSCFCVVPSYFLLACVNLQSLLGPQEKILERIAAVKTKVDGFQTNINK